MKSFGTVYLLINKINGKCYVGQTIRSLDVRVKEHVKGKLSAISKAIKKHGLHNFSSQVLAKAEDQDQLNQLEIFYISAFNSYNEGYNQTPGGDGVIQTPEVLEKKLKYWTTERRTERSKNMSGENSPRFGKPSWNKGVKLSQDRKDKLSRDKKGLQRPDHIKEILKASNNKRKVSLCVIKNGKLETDQNGCILIFKSQHDAARFYNIQQSGISACLRKSNGQKSVRDEHGNKYSFLYEK